MWQKREAEWEREKVAREKLMAEVRYVNLRTMMYKYNRMRALTYTHKGPC